MGGVKNKEAKKKANNVFSAGGGGGTKGPSVVDKRKQGHPCPFCDRTFQQKDRLNAHVKTKHDGEEAGPAADRDAASGSGAGAAAESGEPVAGTSGGSGGTSAAPDRMMRPGSKAGYYTSRSPQLILQDQCRADRRRKPIVKPQARSRMPVAPGARQICVAAFSICWHAAS